MGVSWREVARAAASAVSAQVAIVHRQVAGRWLSAYWVDPDLPLDVERWRPPAGNELQALLEPTPQPSVVETSLAAGLGPLDAATARALAPLLVHRLLVEVTPVPHGRIALWLAAAGRLSVPQVEGVAALVRSLGRSAELDRGPAVPVLMAVLDDAGKLGGCADRLSLLGYEPAEVLGHRATKLFRSRDWERIETALEARHEVVQLRALLKHASGALIPLEIMATRAERADGGASTFIVGHDRRQERQLSHLRRLEAVERLVSGVAHELNNPLQTVVGNAEMLADMKLTDAAHRRAQRVLSGAHRCREVVEGLLKMRRSRRAMASRVDMEEVVRRALRQVLDAERASGVTPRLEADLNLPPVRGDESDLQQAVENVLRNACQAVAGRADPEVRVGLRVVGDTLQLTVADNGTGMDPQTLERAFEPFFSTRGVGGGKGLGLSVALGIVQDHGGLIELQPLDQGTRVIITIPAWGDAAH